MPFTFKLSVRLAVSRALVVAAPVFLGCVGDRSPYAPSVPFSSPPAVLSTDTLFADGFESPSIAWDDNYLPLAKSVVGAAAATGLNGLRVTYQPGADGGSLSKFIPRSDRVYVRAAVRFPANWTGDTKLLLLRAAPAATPWASFGIGGKCPAGTDWAVTNAAAAASTLDLRFYTYFVGMPKEPNGQCLGRAGVAGDGSTASYFAPLSVAKGGWHIVELEAAMNTVGQANGWQKVWLDGALKGDWSGLTFRTSTALQWNAVTLELSSGTITQTQALDLDNVLVLAERPAPPPPITVDTMLVEGFESGAFTSWDDNFQATAHAIVAGAAYTGGRGLRVSYASGGDGGSLSKFVTRRDRVYVRAAVRFPTNWTGDTKLLLLRAAPASSPWGSFGVAGRCPAGTDWAVTNAVTSVPNLDLRFYSYFLGMRAETNGQCWGRFGVAGDGGSTASYFAPLTVSKGGWHTVELEAQMNTVGQANGWQKMWLDGALKGDWSGLTFRTTSALQWNAVTLELSSSTIAQSQTLDVDDVLVLGSRPDAVPASAPPPPPPAPAPPPLPPPPPPPPAPTLARVVLSPDTAIVRTGLARQFAVSGQMSDGSATTLSAAYSATGGTVSASGLYTAGATLGTFRVIATVQGLADTSTVTITQALVATVQVSPTTGSMLVGGTVQLSATMRDAAGNTLSGRAVSWQSSNISFAGVSGSGLVNGLVAGTATITATSEGKSGTASVTVNLPAPLPPPPPPPPAPAPPPSSTGEPVFDGTRHVSLYYEDFEGHASTAALKSAYDVYEQRGSLALETAGGFQTTKALKVSWQAGCGSDGDVLLARSIGGTTNPDLYATFMVRTSPGYSFNSCFPDEKIMIFDQGQTNRTVWNISGAGELPTILCAGAGDAWCMGLTYQVSIDGSSPPPPTGGPFAEYKARAPSGYTWNRLTDGGWHRYTVYERKESAALRGDGIVRTWIDGVLVMDHDGTNPSSASYHKVFTGANGTKWTHISYPTTLNQGSANAQTIWYDNVRAYAGKP